MENYSVLERIDERFDNIEREYKTNEFTHRGRSITYLKMTPFKIAEFIQKRNPHALNANILLKKEVFKDGLIFYRGTEQVEPNIEFSKLIKDNLIPFLYEVMDKIHSLGICPYLYVEKDGKKIPIVPKGEFQIVISRSLKDYTSEYKFIPKNKPGASFIYGSNISGQTDENVKFISGKGFDPTDTGLIVSPLASVIHTNTMVTAMFNYSLEAEAVRTNPVIRTEILSRNADGVQEITTGQFGESSSEREENSYKRTREEFNVAQISKQLYEDFYQNGQNGGKKLKIGELREKHNIAPLPFGHKYVRDQLPIPRTDLQELDTMLQQILFAVYGVPRSIVYESTHARIKSDPNIESFNITVQYWRKILGEILTDWYEDNYGDETLKNNLNDKAKKEGKGVFFLTREEMRKTKENSKITITFPSIINSDDEVLFKTYAMGIMDWNEYQESTRRASGLPILQKIPKEPLNQSEKKLIILSKYIKGGSDDSTDPNKKKESGSGNGKEKKEEKDDEKEKTIETKEKKK